MVVRTRFSLPINKVKPIFLPLLIAIFPPLFHYSNNAAILLLPSLFRMIAFNIILATLIFVAFYFLSKRKLLQASNGVAGFLIFFNTYGILFSYSLKIDIFRTEHYLLFPLYLLLAIYVSYWVIKLGEKPSKLIWNISILVLGVLTVFNIVKIIPAEISKAENSPDEIIEIVDNNLMGEIDAPDIYYIILDEFSGFEPIRTYWHDQAADTFKTFLETNGFFVAENSQARTIDTIYEMATRFNYQEYPITAGSQRDWMNAISNNKAMQYLKSNGYSTAVFDETQFAYESMPTISADYSYNGDQQTYSGLGMFDEFGSLIADNTMLFPFSRFYKINNPKNLSHRNMIFYTVENIASINQVSSPKFVHVHLMLPHFPFMFTENGDYVDPQFHYNWNYYLGNYKFAIKMTEQMIDNILSQADTDKPPIIILQSDHGARNQETGSPDSVVLDNYLGNYTTSILFALYMPGYDYSTIPQDIDPINTFPIIFNHLFDAKIPLR